MHLSLQQHYHAHVPPEQHLPAGFVIAHYQVSCSTTYSHAICNHAGPGRASSAGSADDTALREAMRGLITALRQPDSGDGHAGASQSGQGTAPAQNGMAGAAQQVPSERTAAAVMRVACALAERSPEAVTAPTAEVGPLRKMLTLTDLLCLL